MSNKMTVPMVTGERFAARLNEMKSKSALELEQAKEQVAQAKAQFNRAQNEHRLHRTKVSVPGFTMSFYLTEIESMNDLLSEGAEHGKWGGAAVDAVIDAGLMQLAAATIRFTRGQLANFEVIDERLVRVTSNGKGE